MYNSDLMISVSGVRGIVGQSLTPELLVRLGHAFGTYLNSRRVIVGRDTRVSGEMVRHAVLSGLLASGCEVLDAGVCATPTATLAIEHNRAAGGIMVTASHNPIEWNALKFFRADGVYLNAAESSDLLNIHYSGHFIAAPWNELKLIRNLSDAGEKHVERVLSILDKELIRSKRFRVALDCCNGAGCAISQHLLAELGCKVNPIHCSPNGLFPHKPEPLAANLTELCAFTRQSGADAGFATDPDADRVAVVDASGEYLGEETALALCMRHVLEAARPHGWVAINLSTSRMTEDVALEAGFQVCRTPAGEVNVAEKMQELRATFGGEGNGGIIDPRIHYGRDSIVGIGLMLEAMARKGQSLKRLASTLPRYTMIKTKIDCASSASRALIRQIAASAGDAKTDTRDGMRLEWGDRWVQLRTSNTEPIMRIIAEARTESDARALIEKYSAMIQRLQTPDAIEELERSSETVHAA